MSPSKQILFQKSLNSSQNPLTRGAAWTGSSALGQQHGLGRARESAWGGATRGLAQLGGPMMFVGIDQDMK